jgi:hypothetical protein
MEDEFVSYEIAKTLYKLGFNEPCMLVYHLNHYEEEEDGTITPEFYDDTITNTEIRYIIEKVNGEDRIVAIMFEDSYAIPTWQHVFRWFREQYRLVCIIFNDDGDIKHGNIRYSWEIRVATYSFTDMRNERHACVSFNSYNTYEEAELECLKELIKIAKRKRKKHDNSKRTSKDIH